jgi:hypothetical protein
MRRLMVFAAATVLLFGSFAPGQVARTGRALQIVTSKLDPPMAGKNYRVELQAVGGLPPYHWTILAMALPDGLTLDPKTGVISGIPRSSDGFSILVQVGDSSDPPITHKKLLISSAGAPLTIRWTASPRVQGLQIAGALRVANDGKDDVDLTVIVVAVNEIGKAFALRYEHLLLARGTETPDLNFAVSMPMGQYTVHVDAVGEVAVKNAIYRDRREVEGLRVEAQ